MSDELVEILEEVQSTEKAELCLVRITLDGEEHKWEIWSPLSVVEDNTIAPW